MSRTRWTKDLLSEVRRWARGGYTMRQTAVALGVGHGALQVQASKRKIRFHGVRGPQPSGVPRDKQPVRHQAARQELAREIAAALAEWGQVPPYPGPAA